MQQATNCFDAELIIGKEGFGKVYKGTLENGEVVAIKVANPESRQGLGEFQNEIELLSGLSHSNLVSLVGCYNEDSELILVYNYMANGSLSSHLYGRDFVPLSWKQRLAICLGAAKGLLYLHTGAKQSIIHRDVKTTNILLDKKIVPKVSDFGISKKGPILDKSHVTTNVKVICGKPALDDALPTQQMNLALRALSCDKKVGMEVLGGASGEQTTDGSVSPNCVVYDRMPLTVGLGSRVEEDVYHVANLRTD
ncbi:receptor-like kinase [Medicago truncatula]|uniref:non-specific serine/threonine protein kinase n=1 Tax=Medicago truncatula TaxID=3880 RepID=A0A072V9M0_MEDTR|nr:receptor-like kinase [Medicago truncatula]